MALNAQAIGLKIQEARLSKGLTQAQLGEVLGVGRGTVGRWETGLAVPRQTSIPRVAEVLGREASWLLEGSGNLNPALQNLEVLRTERRTLKEIRQEVKTLARNIGSRRPAAPVNATISPAPVIAAPISATPAPAKTPVREIETAEDCKVLEDIRAAWPGARRETRLLAALLVTGDWSYKLKLLNMEVSVGEDVLNLLGKVL